MQIRLVVIPVLSTAFGAASGVTIDRVLPMAAFGLAWGLGAAALAPRIARRGADSTVVPYLAVALAFVVLGGSLLGGLVTPTPHDLLGLLGHAGFGSFFYAIHASFEWILMPALLMIGWHRPRCRALAVAAALTFYAGRCASALYFAPHALDWGDDPTSADLDQVRLWMNLNWIRVAVQDAATAALLLVLVATGVRARPAGRYAEPLPH